GQPVSHGRVVRGRGGVKRRSGAGWEGRGRRLCQGPWKRSAFPPPPRRDARTRNRGPRPPFQGNRAGVPDSCGRRRLGAALTGPSEPGGLTVTRRVCCADTPSASVALTVMVAVPHLHGM